MYCTAHVKIKIQEMARGISIFYVLSVDCFEAIILTGKKTVSRYS